MAAPIARDILDHVLKLDKQGAFNVCVQFLIRLPWLLLISTSALVFIGALALYSASEGRGLHGLNVNSPCCNRQCSCFWLPLFHAVAI